MPTFVIIPPQFIHQANDENKYPSITRTIGEIKTQLNSDGKNVIEKDDLVKLAKDTLGDNKGLICGHPKIATAVLETVADYAEKQNPKDAAKNLTDLFKLDQETDKAILGLNDKDYKELQNAQAKIYARGNFNGKLASEAIVLQQNPQDIESLLKTVNIDKLTVGKNAIADAVHEFCSAPATPQTKPIGKEKGFTTT